MAILVVNHAGKHGKIMGAWPDYLVSPQKMRRSPGSFGGLGIPRPPFVIAGTWWKKWRDCHIVPWDLPSLKTWLANLTKSQDLHMEHLRLNVRRFFQPTKGGFLKSMGVPPVLIRRREGPLRWLVQWCTESSRCGPRPRRMRRDQSEKTRQNMLMKCWWKLMKFAETWWNWKEIWRDLLKLDKISLDFAWQSFIQFD